MSSDKKQKKGKRWLKITGIIILLLLIGTGAYAYSVFSSLTNAVDTMHQPIRERKIGKTTRRNHVSKTRSIFSITIRC